MICTRKVILRLGTVENHTFISSLTKSASSNYNYSTVVCTFRTIKTVIPLQIEIYIMPILRELKNDSCTKNCKMVTMV